MKPWPGDWKLLIDLNSMIKPEELIHEPINPLYPLYEKVELPETYKSSEG